MLKHSITAAFMALSITIYAQDEVPATQGKMEYSEVVTVDGATKDQVFRTARKFFQKNFSHKATGEDVIYTDDSYLGEMAANPNIWVEVHSMGKNTGAGSVNYNIVIAAKEGKYKYGLSGFYHEANRSQFGSGGAMENATPECGEEEMTAAVWEEIKKDCKSKCDRLIEHMKETMSEAASNSDSDW